ncbi:hypothetical protein C0989_004218 [Termitomyces sp. Mn162]|nr:hypothetical protein C0989_004218 [Termitomyces sp. Mn162]
MLLWSKIVRHLEITLPDHHPEDPYEVDQVFEGAKWVLKGTDTSMTKTSNGTSGIHLSLPIANLPTTPLPVPKQETLELATTTAIVTPVTSNTPATSSPPDSTLAPVAKPADKGKAPKRTVIKEQLPVTKEPVAQPPIHPFSGIPSHYAPPANRNFAAPNRTNDGAYQTMPPIYDIEQSKAVFKWVLSTKVTVSVGELCSVSQDIRNQFRTAVTPKQLVGASANTVQDPSNIFEDILPTFAIEEPVRFR